MSSSSRSTAWVSGRRSPRSRPDVAPFAPGNRPNRLSNVLFSLIRNTTCLMGHRVSKRDASTGSGRRPMSSGGSGRQSGPSEPPLSSANRPIATTAASSGRTRRSTPERVMRSTLPGRSPGRGDVVVQGISAATDADPSTIEDVPGAIIDFTVPRTRPSSRSCVWARGDKLQLRGGRRPVHLVRRRGYQHAGPLLDGRRRHRRQLPGGARRPDRVAHARSRLPHHQAAVQHGRSIDDVRAEHGRDDRGALARHVNGTTLAPERPGGENRGVVSSVVEFLDALDGIVERAVQEEDRVGYFAALYRKVTARAAEWISRTSTGESAWSERRRSEPLHTRDEADRSNTPGP